MDYRVADRPALTDVVINRDQFEAAYQEWREQLCADAFDGMPLADLTGAQLFQRILSKFSL